ncbi:MAG: hypothetical protein HYR60_32665 [Acidobacteria bacterium]|nr:hypothetical protein [Acidobacteriota bacterium]MBI3471546.1 hypothetical protein [Candidatus Solibacter usitatus]
MRLITTLLLCAACLPGQEKEKPKAEEWGVRIFQVKYVNVGHLRDLFKVFRAQIEANVQLKTLTVNAPVGVLGPIEEAVKKLDVPPPPAQNVELTLFIVAASDQPPSGALPADLEPVTKQLRATFGHKGFRLVDTQVIRTRPGETAESSSIVEPSAPRPDNQKIISQYKCRVSAITSDEKGRSIRLDNIRFGLKVPVTIGVGSVQYIDVGLSTDIDVREGQKVVVGKASSIEGGDKASFLVVSAKIVE